MRIPFLARACVLVVVTSSADAFQVKHVPVSDAGGDQLGTSAAATGDMDGDGISDFIVGAPQPALEDPGYAVVLSGKDGRLIRKLTGQSDGDGFGFSVAGNADANGDGKNDVLVSALNHVFSEEHAYANVPGYAFLFSGDDWSVLSVLKSASRSGQFGHQVAFLGDVDGDGGSDVIVCDPSPEDHVDNDPGRVHVFSGKSGKVLYTLEGKHDEGFGFGVAVLDDLDADGAKEFAVSAIHGPVSHGGGLVTVYSGKTGRRVRTIRAPTEREMFGFTLSPGGDYDGDGKADLLIGSNGPGAALEGFRVYSSASGQQLLTVGPVGKYVGGEAACVGDLDGDGIEEVAIANGETVRVYSGQNGTTILATYSRKSAIPPFAGAVFGLPDVSGDGIPELVICAYWDGSGPRNSLPTQGAVYVYSGADHIELYSVTP